jgi:hypothetical protein
MKQLPIHNRRLLNLHLITVCQYAGRHNSVGIAPRYGMNGPGIESRLGARFPAPVQTGPGAQLAFCTTSTVCIPRR